MTNEEFKRIVAYMKSRYGIELQKKKVIVEGRLENYLDTHGFGACTDLMNRVELNPQGTEAKALVDILTTNHTYFMREFEHFEFFREVVLPEIKLKEAKNHDLRIWSAACSSGEEPYTLAMIVKDFLALEYLQWETSILATDISTQILSEAVRGVYTREQIETLPRHWKQAYFTKMNEDEYQIHQELRNHVIYRQFNLMHPFPFKRKMHAIFLRNVMIYFDEDTKRQLISKVEQQLEPGGYLFIGTTESIDRAATNLEYVRPSIYRKPMNSSNIIES